MLVRRAAQVIKYPMIGKNGIIRPAIALSLFLAFLSLVACSRQHVYSQPPVAGGNVVVDAAELRSDNPKFYTYRYHGKNINFFVCKVQGKVVSFLDACASCYQHKRGYRSDEGRVTCRECGMKFSVYQLEKGLGSCYPVKIEGRVEDGKYLIPVATLESSEAMF